jgi:Tryptophan dimethylallyltransferase
MSALLQTPPRRETLGSVGVDALVRLCKATGHAGLVDAAVRVFGAMTRSWRDRPIDQPPQPSDLTDDATPFEFSLAFERGRPDIRMLVEAQGERADAHHQWSAGMDLCEELAEGYGANCAELERVSDLFEPAADSDLRFGLWHGVTFRPESERSEFKAYLNPLVHGSEYGFEVTRDALLRLGLKESADFLASVEKSCGKRARPVYFCLDLIHGKGSRAKVYVAHYEPTGEDAVKVLSRCANLLPSDVSDWCKAVVPEHTRFLERPLLSCLSFTARDPRPCGTLHIPARCYLENDQVLFERILGLLDDVSGELYKSAVRALVARPLQSASGFQTYASLRRVDGARRLTVYLAPEVYALAGMSIPA